MPRAMQEAAMTHSPDHYHGGAIMPAYTGRFEINHIPALRLPTATQDPRVAYRFIHDELMLDGRRTP